MSRRRILFFISVVVFLLTAALLITGSSILIKPMASDPYIPFGTPITWFGIMSLPLSIYFGSEKIRRPNNSVSIYLSGFLKFCLLCAILWPLICYLLAGNFSNSFSEKAVFQGGQIAMKWFWAYTYGLILVPFLILILIWASSLFRKLKK